MRLIDLRAAANEILTLGIRLFTLYMVKVNNYLPYRRTALLTLPIPVVRALRKLGQDIKDARRRRRIPMAIAAQRASISKPTLIRIERGDPGVAIGSYATVLFVMGLTERLADLADAKNDPVGLELEEENLPQRVRTTRRQKRTKAK
jgi:transcriptional regulator with XRE-family HTH domain